MSSITLVLPDEKPPSWNSYYAQRLHWAQRSAMKEDALVVVTDAVNRYEATHGPIALRFPVRLSYTCYYKNAQRRDLSNIMLKCYEDALVKCEVMPDDSTQYVAEMVVRARLDRDGGPRVEITIEEI